MLRNEIRVRIKVSFDPFLLQLICLRYSLLSICYFLGWYTSYTYTDSINAMLHSHYNYVLQCYWLCCTRHLQVLFNVTHTVLAISLNWCSLPFISHWIPSPIATHTHIQFITYTIPKCYNCYLPMQVVQQPWGLSHLDWCSSSEVTWLSHSSPCGWEWLPREGLSLPWWQVCSTHRLEAPRNPRAEPIKPVQNVINH